MVRTAKKIHIDHLLGTDPRQRRGPRRKQPNTLYFTAGINDEADGLFGTIELTSVAKAPPPVSMPGGFPTIDEEIEYGARKIAAAIGGMVPRTSTCVQPE